MAGVLKVIFHVSNISAVKKIPFFFRGDSTLIDESETSSIKKLIRKFFLQWVYNSVDLAFYVGKNNYDYYLKFGLKDKQLFFAPHAIDNKRFSDNKEIYETKANE